jgi:NAD(P)-dependent dehydrogenase (short-subunit alcohol dehydrogenase family)
MAMSFAGRRALVTGGASGIGLATARLLRERGAEVAVIDRAPATGFAARQTDVTDAPAVDAAVRELAGELGGPCDLLVNAAGVYRVEPLLELTPDAWDAVLRINLAGPMLVARAVVAVLGDARGSIVNVSSIAATRAQATEPAAHYRASKGGLEALTRQMAVEWAPRIRVNAVSPGRIDTPLVRALDDRGIDDAFLRAHVPLQRLGRAEEVAHAIAFLLSDEASYITGVAVPVDGGVLCC